MQVKIRVTQFYSGGGKTETRVLLVLSEPLDSFTSEINIITADSKGKTIIKTYEGYSDRKWEYKYNEMFDFSGVDNDSKVTVELLLNDGKKLSAKLKKEVAQDWIFISHTYPGIK